MEIHYTTTAADAFQLIEWERENNFRLWFALGGYKILLLTILWSLAAYEIYHTLIFNLQLQAINLFGMALPYVVLPLLMFVLAFVSTIKFRKRTNLLENPNIRQKVEVECEQAAAEATPRTLRITNETLTVEKNTESRAYTRTDLKISEYKDIILVRPKIKKHFFIIGKTQLTAEQAASLLSWGKN